MTASVTVQLAEYVKTLPSATVSQGLFWAACRATADGLDLAPLVTAAEKAGLGKEEAQAAVAQAVEHMAEVRAAHGL